MTSKLIRETAKELAGAYWEENHTDRFRHFWPNVKTFIARNWPSFGELAMTILTDMLRRKEAEVSEKMKEEIFEALQENAKEAAHRRPEKVGRGPMMLRPDRPGAMEQHLFWRK